MNPEIENLIELSLADGQITEKERSVIIKKAILFGIDEDEIEMIIDARIHQYTSTKNKKENINKCPNCGNAIFGLSQVCDSCGYVLSNSTINNDEKNSLHEKLNYLQNLIIEVKSYPKPSFFSKIKVIFLTYFTIGFYLIYRKIKKSVLNNNGSFENLVAKCEKETQSIKIYYGDDKKVKAALNELNLELNNQIKIRKNTSIKANIAVIGSIIVFIALNIWNISYVTSHSEDFSNSNKTIDSLISINQFNEAKREALKLSKKFKRDATLDLINTKILESFLYKDENIDSAKYFANQINNSFNKKNAFDEIYKYEVLKLVNNKKFDDARLKIELIENIQTKEHLTELINNKNK